METKQTDPITFEVIRNKLFATTEEQRITLASVSGSPVVTEASDFYNGIFLADGTIVTMGLQVASHAGSMDLIIKALLGDIENGLDVAEGDAFVANDTYRGALHLNDVDVIAPIFYRGKLVAWCGSSAHQVDVGGMDFASWCPKATEVFQEGLRIPGVKIMDKGKMRIDVMNLILAASRLPAQLGLDIKAMISACRVAQKRVTVLMDRYGEETVIGVMHQTIDHSEALLRLRLRELPDGIYRAEAFIEHDGHTNRLYRIALTATKQDDHLTLDFSESSDQSPGYINCARGGLIGGLVGSLFPGLAWDIPWNGGLLRPITVMAREGSICNARFPAPASAATVEASFVAHNCVNMFLARLLGSSDKYREEAHALPLGTVATFNLGGIDQYGQRFGNHFLDPTLGGFGAYSGKDGFDIAGANPGPVNNVANVESIENLYPLLYLHRRFIQDSGGPGRYRGGRCAGMALTVHHVPAVDALVMTHGVEAPDTSGAFGGYPGSCVVQKMLRNSDLRQRFGQGELPRDVSEAAGELEVFGPRPGRMPFTANDIFETSWEGGGGWGDPLEREPERVLADVIKRAVSPECAHDIYGVVIDRQKRTVESAATERLRESLRQKRLGGIKRPTEDDVSGRRVRQIGEYITIWDTGSGRMNACRCGQGLGPADENWKLHAHCRIVQAEEAGPHMRLHEELEFRTYICPRCGLQLSAEITLKASPPLWEVQFAESALV